MELKDYQNDVLESLSRYLQALAARREEAEEILEFQRSKGRDARLNDYCHETWDALHMQKALPMVKDEDGTPIAPQYVARKDGLERPVPNICLKVPTGGGKTLLGTVSVERINAEYFKKQTGFTLWIVPSEAIYSQTWKAFANREHPFTFDQGWQRSRVYPDFLACLHDAGDGKVRFTVLETKGLHLKGNDDTNYKARLFELLTRHSESALSVGELKLGFQQQHLRFELMLENEWREKLPLSLLP